MVVVQWDLMGIYHLVMTNSLPTGKSHRSMEVYSWGNHLFLWVMASMAMLNNQMVAVSIAVGYPKWLVYNFTMENPKIPWR